MMTLLPSLLLNLFLGQLTIATTDASEKNILLVYKDANKKIVAKICQLTSTMNTPEDCKQIENSSTLEMQPSEFKKLLKQNLNSADDYTAEMKQKIELYKNQKSTQAKREIDKRIDTLVDVSIPSSKPLQYKAESYPNHFDTVLLQTIADRLYSMPQ